MDNYTAMCDTPEIRDRLGLKDDSRFYVKEDIWGFRDSDAKERRQEFEDRRKWYAKNRPERMPIKATPLLEKKGIVVPCYPLGEDGDNDYASVNNLLIKYPNKFIWLPRQDDWQNLVYPRYLPALPAKKKLVDFTVLNMHKEFLEFWESRLGWFEQPIEYWCAFYMMLFHKKTWKDGGWDG